MPGYRPLRHAESEHHIGIAERADELSREGADAEAACLLEEFIADLESREADLPTWPYGRLAFVYRRMRRYSDEVDLLERYMSLQADEEQAVRFNARLSKARALVAKMNRSKIMPLRTDRASTIPCWQTPSDL
ncbi:MAG: hypothetical protein ABIY52_17855 [Gemmatimonadaceae bacterium]